MLELIEKTQIKNGKQYALYRCVCGAEKEIRIAAVNSGSTKSCGCHRKNSCKKVGLSAAKHNKSKSYEYQYWARLKAWCNPDSKKYKGYSLCNEWNEFEYFDQWYTNNKKDGHSLYWHGNTISPETCYFDNKNTVKQQKREKQNIRTYGTKTPQQLQKIKEKTAKTNLDKYGTKTPSENQFIKNKIKNIFIEKYGKHPSQVESIKQKTKNTNILRYGYSCTFQNEGVRNTFKKNMLEKYGVEHPMHYKLFKDKSFSTILKKYGVDYAVRLPQCRFKSGSHSKQEKEIQIFLKDCGFDFVKNREVLDGNEIDLYNDSLKIGIEYCGLYWHTERTLSKNYHFDKMKKCRDKGVKLITIFGDEWDTRKKQIKNHLRSILGINQRIFARKTTIKEIDPKEAVEFINNNHIQKISKKPLLSLGLYTDHLVSVMTLDRHHRGLNKIVLNRFCSEEGISVSGGASKLLKRASESFKEIWSWSDNRYSDGNVYETIGFQLITELGPDYSYVDLSGKRRKSKQSMKKGSIGCPKEISEKDFLKNLGYYRIWDCGKKTWKFSV